MHHLPSNLTISITFFFTLSLPLCLLGKETIYAVQGVVVDNMTVKGVPAHLTLMTTDSVVIDTTTAVVSEMPFLHSNEPYGATYRFSVRETGSYIIKAEMDGYEDAYIGFELRSNREGTVFVKTIRLQKNHLLSEVVIKASRIKMVMRDDTIVYNADAFNLPEGSMLDALIARLPGVQLTKDGKIFVNGKYVQSMLINGKNFFSGNPKLALENLPSYTVSKIKVYDEAGPMSRIMARDMGDKTYVMDVRLKKDTGHLCNAEAGAGTSKRYTARVFGMGFTEGESFFGFANVNNLSDTRQASFNGEWTKPDTNDGLIANKTVNVSYAKYLKDKLNWFSSQNTYTHINADNQTRTHTQTFLPAGYTWRKRNSSNTSNTTYLKSDNMYKYEKGLMYSLNTLNIKYSRDEEYTTSNQIISDPAMVINRMDSWSLAKKQQFSFTAMHEGGLRILADMLRWNIETKYDHLTPTKSSYEDVQYTSAPLSHDQREKIRNEQNRHLNVRSQLEYNICWPKRSVAMEYEYRHINNKAKNLLYRLDRINETDSTQNTLMLPSAADALNNSLDKSNSYQFHEYQNHHVIQMKLTGEPSPYFYWVLKFPLRFVKNNLYYERMKRHDVSREATFFEPSLYSRGSKGRFSYELNADITSSIPNMISMADYRDDSDPLNIRSGNASLRNTRQYNIVVSMRQRGAHQQMTSVKLGYHLSENAVAYSREFDQTTGISFYRPVNLNGNWIINVNFEYTRTLGKSGKMAFENRTEYDYQHCVDMAMLTGMANSQRCVVNNHHIRERLKWSCRIDSNCEFNIFGGGKYYIIYSHQKDFSNIHAYEFNVGANTTFALSKELQFDTEFNILTYRGYQLSEMNTTNWTWNAQFSYIIVKNVLSLRLKGFDILKQLTNTQYAVNAQGHTETWTNSIPNYIMATMTWRFTKPSSNKKIWNQ